MSEPGSSSSHAGSSSSHANAPVIGNLLSHLHSVQGTALSSQPNFEIYITPYGDKKIFPIGTHHVSMSPLYVGEQQDFGIFHISAGSEHLPYPTGRPVPHSVPTGRMVANVDIPMGTPTGFRSVPPTPLMQRAQRLSDSLPERLRKESERSERMSREEGFFVRRERERREAEEASREIAEEAARRTARGKNLFHPRAKIHPR